MFLSYCADSGRRRDCGPFNNTMRKFLVSATRTDRFAEPWREDVELVDEVEYVDTRTSKFRGRWRNYAQRWFELQFSIKVLFDSRQYNGFAVGRCGVWLPILLRLSGQKKNVVLTEVEYRGGSGIIMRLACLCSSAVLSFSREEIRRYSSHFKVPASKFLLQPAVYSNLFETKDGGYVFAGGNQARDWPTFIRAVSDLLWPVQVVTSHRLGSLPKHVSVSGAVSPDEFNRRIAAASCVVVPTVAERFRITGMATWVTAMALGKVLICTDPQAAGDYFENGVSGFCVEHGDAIGLRNTIDMVMRDKDLRTRVGKAARERALREFSPQRYRERVLQILDGKANAATVPM